MRRISMILLAGAAIATGSVTYAQSSGEATIYSKGHFKGPSLSFTGPLTNIDPPFTAKSVRIAPGSAWELCSGKTFTGCRRIDKSVEAGVFSVRSARPIAPVIRSGGVGAGVGVSADGREMPNQTLRGFASEFFVAPNQGGQRVGVADNKPESMRASAHEFCRSAGWRQSIHARLQEFAGRLFLVDVLCSNDD